MCNNCNCDNYKNCRRVGFMPIGFCCSQCILYDKHYTCLKTKTRPEPSEIKPSTITPVSISIEEGVLKVTLQEKDKKFPIIIDLNLIG